MSALDRKDGDILSAIEDGLPISHTPFADVAGRIGLTEAEVIERIARLQDAGIIKRLGLVVRHRELGYCANAMVVWDVPDQDVGTIGPLVAAMDFVTLCYRRPRRLPHWSFNLFCMIHGTDRKQVRRQIMRLNHETGLGEYPSATLFSRKRFKQRGACYSDAKPGADIVPLDPIDRRIINSLQGGFPISEHPFAAAAATLDISEADLIRRIDQLCANGILSRFGPLYNAERMGGGVILAAMAVPEADFDHVTELVNAHPETAHNYAREHHLNMWFVLSAERTERIDEVIKEIEAETGLSVYPMPKLEEYFVEFKVEA